MFLAPSNGFETVVVLVTQSILCTKRKMEENSSTAVVCGIGQQPFIFNLATHEKDQQQGMFSLYELRHLDLHEETTYGAC
jgi:hypothetical protein